ncbi:LacI family DNA-binding transcriptional regulator [Roseibium sp. MMSF_3544]|uniref:LacI family DNA-binding transcriptional regulator n=1 Tax=unclassified Roseibium TaxID=2629323 RepID=UPI00273F6B07|nr:LacI family DNA-binding transcriptional regulator [Roseibium sp. MMSF_3544]
MSNVTLKDVADVAQVSLATVDRVLHEREGVSAKARQRVKEAIHELGFGQLPSKLRIKSRGRLRLLFLLPKLDTGFVRQMVADIQSAKRAVPDVEILAEIRRVRLLDGNELIKSLESVERDKYQGVGLFAFDAPGVRAAIDETIARGIPVVTLVSDIPSSQRVNFVGIDNMAAGRTAGRLMGKFLRGVAGEIGVLTGNSQIRDHLERHMGFRQVLGTHYRDLKLLPEIEGDSVSARNRSIVIDLIRDHPRLVGLYAIGGGNSGVISALREMNPVTRPVVIAHELTKETRKGLSEELIDAVIAQKTGHMARSAVRLLTAASLDDDPNPEQERIGIDVFVAENMP